MSAGPLRGVFLQSGAEVRPRGRGPSGRRVRVIGYLLALTLCVPVAACDGSDGDGAGVVGQTCSIVGPVAEAVASRLAAGKVVTVAIIAEITGVIVEQACLDYLSR
ncbi:hypothetical protein [Nocardia sp. NPDC058705]|uniref:hypothetical protein n=1 Tax=Nocardia sp. NPDC058705 TaxID=3346609 RepID=UPI0036C8DD78